MRYLSSISLALIVHVLLSIGMLMALACTAAPAEKTATGLDRPFILSDDVDSQRGKMAIYLAYQRQHPEMRNWGDEIAQSNAPMVETQFALRPEASDGCQSPTLRHYQEALKKYDPASNRPSNLTWDDFQALSNRIHLVSQLLNGDSVDYKAAGLKKCHLDVLKDMFESTYASRTGGRISHPGTQYRGSTSASRYGCRGGKSSRTIPMGKPKWNYTRRSSISSLCFKNQRSWHK